MPSRPGWQHPEPAPGPPLNSRFLVIYTILTHWHFEYIFFVLHSQLIPMYAQGEPRERLQSRGGQSCRHGPSPCPSFRPTVQPVPPSLPVGRRHPWRPIPEGGSRVPGEIRALSARERTPPRSRRDAAQAPASRGRPAPGLIAARQGRGRESHRDHEGSVRLLHRSKGSSGRPDPPRPPRNRVQLRRFRARRGEAVPRPGAQIPAGDRPEYSVVHQVPAPMLLSSDP